MKRMIGRLINAIGYDIHRIKNKRDLDLYYEIYGEDSVKECRFYNIGAGTFRHPAWTNVDLESDWYSKNKIDISWDLLSITPIPVESNCAEIVYSSHTVEHITDKAAQNMFSESHRILKKGGFFRVTTPNIDLEYKAWKNNDRHFFYWIGLHSIPEVYKRAKLNRPLNEASIHQIFLHHFAGSASTLHSDSMAERISDDQLDRIFSEMD